jgi:hypothetical protein
VVITGTESAVEPESQSVDATNDVVDRSPSSSNTLATLTTAEIPAELSDLLDEHYVPPELVGRLFDSVILSGDVLRPLADEWCTFATRCLFRIARVVCPLRVAVETARAAARVVSSPIESTVVGSGLVVSGQ